MKTTIKRWAGLGLGTAFLGTGLAACGSSDEVTPPVSDNSAVQEELADDVISDIQPLAADQFGEGGEGEGGEGESGEAAAVATLPLPKRLAFMSGHVKAGLALYRAGAPDMAAPHLLHPVSETHQAERVGLDELGFDASLFEVVSQALKDGLAADEIEAQLAAAEANLDMVTAKAGGDDVEIIRYLMDTIVAEYTISITDGVVSDPGEYQDAYGFAVVARERAARMQPKPEELLSTIDTLIGLWPTGTLPPENPTPVGKVVAQTSLVTFALPSR